MRRPCSFIFLNSDLERLNTFFKLVLEHASEGLEGLLDAFALHGRRLEELKSNGVGKASTILRVDGGTLTQIHFVGEDDALELATLILLFDALVPLAQEVEAIGVGHIVDEDDLISLAKQIKGDLFENVLASNVDQVQLHAAVRLVFGLDVLDLVFAALGHHVVVVE